MPRGEKNRRLSEEQRATAVPMVAGGMQYAEVAILYGVSKQRIHQLAKAAGISSRK
jgi:transposase-like protein